MSGCTCDVSKVLFRLGQITLLSGAILYIVSIATAFWVVRPTVKLVSVNASSDIFVTKHYGIFSACRQIPGNLDDDVECDSLWVNLLYINANTARYVQFVMCLAAILYGGSFILEVVQFLPIDRYRNFIAKNRIVEMFATIATVLVLQGIVIFSGEIKNKADRVAGQEDETAGWSFVTAIIGLLMCVVGSLFVIMFRELPLFRPDKFGGSWLRPTANAQRKNSVDS